MGPLLPHITGHIAFSGSRLLHGQEDLWETTWRCYGWFECEFGYLGNVHEFHLSSSSSFPKRLWHEIKFFNAKNRSKNTEIVCVKIIEFEEITWRSKTPKSMSSPIQYFGWARWEVTQSQSGWKKLNGIRRTTISRNWIASMRTSSSSPSRQVAPSRIILAWRPTEWQQPAHDNSHIMPMMEKKIGTSYLDHRRSREAKTNLFWTKKNIEKRNGTWLLGWQLQDRKKVVVDSWSKALIGTNGSQLQNRSLLRHIGTAMFSRASWTSIYIQKVSASRIWVSVSLQWSKSLICFSR